MNATNGAMIEPMGARESLSPGSTHVSYVRKRAPTACRVCRQRKVKCNVVEAGIPCLNCVRDGHPCEVRSRKRRAYTLSHSDDLIAGAATPSLGQFLPSAARHEPSPLSSLTTPPATVASATSYYASPTRARSRLPHESAPGTDEGTIVDQDSAVRERGPDDYAIESLASSIMEDTVEATTETYYVGDQQGIGYILDIVGEPGSISQHYGLPYMVDTHDLTPEDVAYLRSKGVFTVPSEPVCEALFIAYFHHVHTILPVVDAAVVLTSFRSRGASAINLLLLWSMFSVAANYVDKAVVRQAGYQTHKDMKKSMFTRAKCLYDNGCEKDRIALIQSVSLMAFWYSDLSERTESWHWMGIAISLSQTLGLNRDPDRGGQYNTRLSDRQRQLWRRIWWSCFFRDRWLSLNMGRPMRINPRDCDTPMPSAEDLISDVGELPSSTSAKYLPPDFRHLASHWVVLLNASRVLGSILSENYSPNGLLPARAWVEATEKEIAQCVEQAGQLAADASPLLSFYSYHLRLHFNAASIALWRPFLNKPATGTPLDQASAWFALVHQKIRTAAADTNTVLDKVIGEQLISHIGPMTVPLLVPAMNSHLLESKSSDPLIRQSSLHKLDLFMIVLKEIQDVYSSATFVRGLFLQAIEKLNSPIHTSVANTPQPQPQPFRLRSPTSAADSTAQLIMPGRADQLPLDAFWKLEDQVSEFWDPLALFDGVGIVNIDDDGSL